ncbi:hypothetical protein [Microcoleus sp. Pol11C3]
MATVASSIGILSGNDPRRGCETHLLCGGFATKSNNSPRNQPDEA